MDFINKDTEKLIGVIELLLQSSSRINELKNRKYWYPLSRACYGVEEIVESLDSLCSYRTSMWEKTHKFERKFTEFQGCYDSVMVNSGSSADLLICYQLLSQPNPLLNEGDEILIPIVTWPTQIWAAKMAGLKVKFVDVDPITLNIDLQDLKNKISDKTRALFIVHLMGNPCNMDTIKQIIQDHDLILIEDCCEALGSKWDNINVGNFGIVSSFSFFFSHHMTTMEGGLIACSRLDIAEQMKILRSHGWLRNVDQIGYNIVDGDLDPRYTFSNWGFNLRPTEIQASFGLHQLKKLNDFNTKRNKLAVMFFNYIDEQECLNRPIVDEKAIPSWFSLPLMVEQESAFTRKELVEHLEINGVETRPILAGNLAKHPVAEYFPEFKEYEFTGADLIHSQGIYIGLSPFTEEYEIDKLINIFEDFLTKHK